MQIRYSGESKRGKEDRFAVITAKESDEDKIVDVLASNFDHCTYDTYGFGEEINVWVPVEDKDDFKAFSKMFRKALQS